MTDSHLSDLSFSSLNLPEAVQKGLADAGFERCTPIQAQTLPQALAGFDIAGQAQTGTGKTAAFLVALYTTLLKNPAAAGRNLNAPRAIIVAPTRELAVQIHSDAELLGASTGLRLGLAFGGVDYEKQRRHLEAGVDILIGTPGRIIDFFKQHVIDLRFVQVAVLDEADRMFDLGFISDIRFILRRLPAPERRLNLLFSATLSHRVLELAYEHMNSPQLVRIEPDKMTVDRVRQVMYYPANDEKPRLLVGLIKHMNPQRSMVFVNTRRAAEDVERVLRGNGINAEAISGDVPQRKRLRMLRDFHDGVLAVLIGTDVASRGLHIPDVSHIFNYDLPNEPEDYVHRIGRTARAGAEGDAISFGCEEYVMSLPDIEAYIGRRLPVSPVPQEFLAELAPSESRHKQRYRLEHETGVQKSSPSHGSGNSAQRRSGRPGGGGGRGPRRQNAPHRSQPRTSSAQTSPEQNSAGQNNPSANTSDVPHHEGVPQAGASTGAKRRRRRGGKKQGSSTVDSSAPTTNSEN